MYDQHTIETPEQMSLNLALAGIGSRFLAIVVDTLIQIFTLLVLLFCLFLLGFAGALTGFEGNSVWTIAIFGFCLFLLFYGYFAIFEILWNGQTPGKRLVGIRVVKDSGRPLNAAETIGRNLLRIVDQLPVLYLLGMVVAMSNSRNRRLGDFVAGSILIREGSLEQLKPQVFQASRTDQPAVFASSPGALALSLEDLTLIDTFLSRRHSLESHVRSRTAAQILARIRAKLPLAPDVLLRDGMSDEATLEALAYERRSAGRS